MRFGDRIITGVTAASKIILLRLECEDLLVSYLPRKECQIVKLLRFSFSKLNLKELSMHFCAVLFPKQDSVQFSCSVVYDSL